MGPTPLAPGKPSSMSARKASIRLATGRKDTRALPGRLEARFQAGERAPEVSIRGSVLAPFIDAARRESAGE